jgi:hypothetical protein
MALRMKYWLGLVLIGVALVSVWRLPPEALTGRSAVAKPAETLRLEEIKREFKWTAETLRRVLWSDSLAPLLVSQARDGTAFLFPSVESLNEEQLGKLDAKIRNEVEETRLDTDELVFGYVLQPSDHAASADMPPGARRRAETYVGSLGGIDYCMQVRVQHRQSIGVAVAAELAGTDPVAPRSNLLGACRPYVRYGLAGPRVQEWLEQGGVSFAIESGAPEDAYAFPGSLGRRSYFGYSSLGRSNRPIEADRCLAGDAGACAFLFRNPTAADRLLANDLEVVLRSPATSIGTESVFRSIALDEEYLLADLEAEFGTEAFGRFWTSEGDVEVAFREAFGMEAGSWVVSWTTGQRGFDPPGPGLPRSASSGTMLALALLLGVAYLRMRERKVA